MATPLELADITRRMVEELSEADQTVKSSTFKLFSALNANEKSTVQAQARAQLQEQRGAQTIDRIRLQGEQQLRRDQLKTDAELAKLRQKTDADILKKRTPTATQELKVSERARKIRLAEARQRIGLATSGQIPTNSALEAITLLSEVDPDAARMLRRRFQPPAVQAPAFGSSPGQPVPRRLSLAPTSGPSLLRQGGDIGERIRFGTTDVDARTATKAKRSFRGKLGLGGAAVLGIPLLLKLMGGSKQQPGSELPPQVQMQLMQAMAGGGGGGTDPALGTGRDLRNVFKLLQIIKTITDMQGLQQQPEGGLV